LSVNSLEKYFGNFFTIFTDLVNSQLQRIKPVLHLAHTHRRKAEQQQNPVLQDSNSPAVQPMYWAGTTPSAQIMPIFRDITIYSILRSYADQNEQIVISHKIDTIRKPHAQRSPSSVSRLHCQKISVLEYWVQPPPNPTPVNRTNKHIKIDYNGAMIYYYLLLTV